MSSPNSPRAGRGPAISQVSGKKGGKFGRACRSVVICAAQVIAALSANELAPVAGESMRAGRANLAMMLNWSIELDGTGRTTL
jgi:hypothetical protein